MLLPAFPVFPFEGPTPSLFVLSDGSQVNTAMMAFSTSSGNKEYYKDLFLVDVQDGISGKFIKWASKTTGDTSINFIKDNYYNFNIPERAAIIRWVPNIISLLIEDEVDLESIFRKAVAYVDSLDISEYIKNVCLRVKKHAFSRVGKDDDKFTASIVAELPARPSNDFEKYYLYIYDEYIKKVFHYSSNDYSDSSMLSCWDMQAYFELNHEARYLKLADELTKIYRDNLLKQYSRVKHINSIFRILKEKMLEKAKITFVSSDKELVEYNQKNFPLERHPNGRLYHPVSVARF